MRQIASNQISILFEWTVVNSYMSRHLSSWNFIELRNSKRSIITSLKGWHPNLVLKTLLITFYNVFRSQASSKSLRPKSTSAARARQSIVTNSSPVTRRISSSDDWRNASCYEEEGPLASYLSFKQFAANKRQNSDNTLGSGAAGKR